MSRKKIQIIKKSQCIFEDNSFFSISMQDIADKLNIRKSLLYYYFESKSKLFCEVIENTYSNIVSQFETIFDLNMTTCDKIEKLSEIYIRDVKKNNFLNLLQIDKKKIDKNILTKINKMHNDTLNYFENVIREGIKKGELKEIDPKTMSMMIIGYLDKINNNKIDKNILNYFIK